MACVHALKRILPVSGGGGCLSSARGPEGGALGLERDLCSVVLVPEHQQRLVCCVLGSLRRLKLLLPHGPLTYMLVTSLCELISGILPAKLQLGLTCVVGNEQSRDRI